MSYLEGLNDVQRDAVTTINGPVLVVAGPGSGKTRVLTFRIAHLIESGVPPYQILALTFTNKAAREMKERISKVVGDKANQVWAGTFHSIFARILRVEADKIGYPSSFTIYDTQDSKSLIKDIVKTLKLDPKKYKEGQILGRISNAKSNLISPPMYKNDAVIRQEDNAQNRPEIHAIYKAYVTRCKRAGAMDFDDLLYQLFVLFHKNPDNVLDKYRKKFPYILVDEFQDTNFLQYSIVSKLAKYEGSAENICSVGDDAQSIYSFRGATIKNILDFEKDFPTLKTFKLEQNYRSTDYIVRAANEIITHNKNQIPKKIWSHKGAGDKIKLIRAITDVEEGSQIASSIIEQRNRLHYKNKEIAILYRTNAQSRVFEEHLRRYGIPYRIFGGLSFYQRKEIKDAIAYLRVATNPHDDEAMRRIINYPKRGIGNTTTQKITDLAAQHQVSFWQVIQQVEKTELGSRPKKLLVQFRELVKVLIAKLEREPDTDAYEMSLYILKTSTLFSTLKADTSIEGTGRYENLVSLLDGIKEFVENDELIDEATLPDKTLTSYLQNIALITDMDTDAEDDDKVTLMSVHAAKGLEFKSVFVTGLEENLLPSMMSKDSPEGIDEERRLFYVAVTRAEEVLTLSYATSRFQFGNIRTNEPSRFLQEISPSNFDDGASLGPRVARVSAPTSTFKRASFSKASTSVPSDFKVSPAHEIKEGKSVLHQRFGKGKVVEIQGGTGNKVASIDFKEAGKKRIMLRFAKLQVLD